jgi:hypothetical protein
MDQDIKDANDLSAKQLIGPPIRDHDARQGPRMQDRWDFIPWG